MGNTGKFQTTQWSFGGREALDMEVLPFFSLQRAIVQYTVQEHSYYEMNKWIIKCFFFFSVCLTAVVLLVSFLFQFLSFWFVRTDQPKERFMRGLLTAIAKSCYAYLLFDFQLKFVNFLTVLYLFCKITQRCYRHAVFIHLISLNSVEYK
jgi:hypothetical protein